MPKRNETGEKSTFGSVGAYTPTKADKTLRLAAALLLPAIFYLVCAFMNVDSLFWLLPAACAAAVLFSLPCLISTARIGAVGCASVKPFVKADALYCLFPALGASFVEALFLYLFFDRFAHIFLQTLLLCVLFTLLQFCFWPIYFVANSVRRLKKR